VHSTAEPTNGTIDQVLVKDSRLRWFTGGR
jgi:hypothetical protein